MFDDIIIGYFILPLLGCIANFSFFLLVYLKDRKNPVNITFALSNLCLAIWNFSFFRIYFTAHSTNNNQTWVAFWGQIAFIMLVFIPALFFHFVLAITQDFTRWKRKLTFATYALGFVVAIIIIYDDSLYFKFVEDEKILYPTSGFFNYFYNIMYISFSAYGCYLLFKEYRETTSAIRKNQLKYLLLGVSIGLFGGMFCIPYVVHLLKIYPVGNIYSVGHVGVVLYSVLVAHAIIKYRLMEIHVFLKKWAIYLTVFVLAVGAFFLTMHFSLKIPGISEVNYLLLSSVLTTILVFVFFRIYPQVHSSVERVLPSEEPDSTTEIEKLGNKILSKTNLNENELIKDTFDELIEILDLSGGCMLLREDGSEGYVVIYAVGCCSNSEENILMTCVDILLDQEGPIVKEELELRASHNNSGQQGEELLDAAEQLGKLRIAVCIPLIIRDDIIGLLNLGPKKSDRIFSPEELSKLDTLGNKIAIALENAKLLDESRNRAKEQEILSRIATEIMSVHNPVEIEQQIFTYIDEIIDYDRFLYFRWSDETGSLLLEDEKGFDENAKELLRQIPIKLENRRNIPDDESEIGFDTEWVAEMLENYLEEKKVKQSDEFALSVPFSMEKKLHGLFCTFKSQASYTEEEKQLLRVIGTSIVALRERMSTTLAQAETKAMMRTLREIAHDMSKAIGVLRGSLELMQERLVEVSATDESVTSLIHSEMANLNRILKEIRRLIDVDKTRLQQEEVNAALENALQLVESHLSNIKVNRNLQANKMFVFTPSGQLNRVFFNLLFNAIEAMPQGGVLTIATKLIASHDTAQSNGSLRQKTPEPRYNRDKLREHELRISARAEDSQDLAEITISDTGCGIHAKHLNKIYRSGFTTKESGSGIGLAEVKRVIETCNGKITVNSQVGVGTTFVIQLPCYS